VKCKGTHADKTQIPNKAPAGRKENTKTAVYLVWLDGKFNLTKIIS